jgi:acyl carrier protein
MKLAQRIENLSPNQRSTLAQQLKKLASSPTPSLEERGHLMSAQKRLVAYVVLASGKKAEDLRQFVGVKLPDYMIPSTFVFLDSLPQTPNGKVDRNALPSPESIAAAPRNFAPPRTPVEEKLSAIWADVLRVEKVGIEENFFDLGGHSLLAIQVMARVRDTFQVEIPLRSLFEALTVAALAEEIVTAMISQTPEEEIKEMLAG